MLLIRPYTITSLAVVLETVYLIAFLTLWAHRKQPETRRLNHALAYSFGAFLLLSILQVALAASDNLWIDTSKVLRSQGVLLVMLMCGRFLYKLLAETTAAFAGEQRYFMRFMLALFVIDAAIIAYHIRPTLGVAPAAQRAIWLDTPLLLGQLWVVVLAVRGWRTVEHEYRDGRHGWRALLLPRAPLVRFLRSIALAVVLTLFFTTVFVVLVSVEIPLWVRSAGDFAALVILLVVTFAYMTYRLRDIGLELRIVSVGLAFFLTLSAALGWLVSMSYVQLNLPGVRLQEVVGTPTDVLFTTPAVYLPIARNLSNLLLPIALFQIIGSVFFIVGYHFYYRIQIDRGVSSILEGIDAFADQRFDHRIPTYLRDELGTIAVAFNELGETIGAAQQTLRAYQTGLEKMVETRTAALQTEIEQRHMRELDSALLQERERLAREAHDGILQTLVMIRMQLRSRRLAQLPPAALAERLSGLADDVLAAANELRAIIHARSLSWQALGHEEALTAIVNRALTAYNIPIALHIAPDLPALTAAQQTAILRIVQEGLANIGRHSAAHRASVSLRRNDAGDGMMLCIEDDGRGFDVGYTAGSSGYGLHNMRARAADLGATLIVQSATAPAAPTGTRIALHLLEQNNGSHTNGRSQPAANRAGVKLKQIA